MATFTNKDLDDFLCAAILLNVACAAANRYMHKRTVPVRYDRRRSMRQSSVQCVIANPY